MAPKKADLSTTRRLGLLLGAAALLGGCDGVEPLPKPVPPTTTATATCPASGVTVTAGEVDGAGGLRALGIQLTNCGGATYRVQGFPSVRVLDADRKPLPVTVGNGSSPVSAPDGWDTPPVPLTLAAGESARARVLWRNTVTDSTAPAAEGSYLEVTPAAGEPAQLVAVRGGIDLGNTGRLAVNAWSLRS
ncbi:DUF4232 domain-containing protein [Micromonospora sp. NPDC049559]|uniref:DUF4232 domain-containing protein n=1 Tax=Micromonospora sp. NPDC049559 TaxID=3155923 RepID=UPI00342BF9C3